MVKSSASMPEAVNHKSSSKMVNETNKMMGYFNALPAIERAQLLVSLCNCDPNINSLSAMDGHDRPLKN
jgi:hypothetical protein